MRWTENGWEFKLVDSRDKRSPELWDYIPKSFVINLPVSYPARQLDGIMVTGMLTPKLNEKAVYPVDFLKELKRVVPNYRFELNWNEYKGREEDFLRDVIEVTKQRERLINHLISKDWNLFFTVIACTDRVQHLSFNTDVMSEYFRFIDGLVGNLMEGAERGGYNLIIVSDHGFGPVNKSFYPNYILVKEGLLVPRSGFGVSRETLKRILKRLGLLNLAVKLYRKRKELIKLAKGLSNPVDFDPIKSVAIAYGYGSIYVRDEEKVGKVKEIIERASDPDTGDKIVEKVFRRDELYRGPYLNEAPNLVAVLRRGYAIERQAYRMTSTAEKRGDHTRNGIFLAMGPDIGQGKLEASVLDVMPTIMHTLGLSIPPVDGKVLPIFKEGSAPYIKEPMYMSKKEELRKRVRETRRLLKR